MNNIITYIKAENYKFSKSSLWKTSIIIGVLCSIFFILAMPKDNDWRADLFEYNQDIETQLNMSADEIKKENKNNIYIKQWKENNAYLEKDIEPPTVFTFQGYLSSVLSFKGLGLLFVVFPILFAVQIAKEHESGTIKFMMISSYSRFQIILGKYLHVIFLSLLFLTIMFIVNFCFGFLSSHQTSSTYLYYSDGIIKSKSIYSFMLQNNLLSLTYYLSYATLAFMIATVSRSVMLSLSISLFLALISTHLLVLFNFSKELLHFVLPAIVELTHQANKVTIAESNNYSTSSCIFIILGYIAVFLFISFKSFTTKDI